jgi:hypothetical protein
VRVTGTCGPSATNTANSSTIVVNVTPPTPTGVTANFVPMSGLNVVAVSWTGATGNGITYTVDGVERTGGTLTTVSFDDVTLTTFYDTTVVAAKAYLYSVRRKEKIGAYPAIYSASSTADLVTTVQFTDDPLRAIGDPLGATAVKGIHFSEVRQAIDAVRALAGLPPGWGSYSPLTGPILYTQLSTTALTANVSMLAGLNQALTIAPINRAAASYSLTPLVGGPVKVEHIQVLREAVR